DVNNRNNGLLEGNVTFAPGQVGQAFKFNDTNSDVKFAASASLNVGLTNGFTVEAWINPDDITQPYPILEWNDGSSQWGAHFYIATEDTPGRLFADIPDTGFNIHYFYSTNSPVTSNVFQHVALTYNKVSGLATMYYNGVVVAQQNLGSFTA